MKLVVPFKIIFSKRSLSVLFPAIFASGCVTSSHLARGRDNYVDPTNVKTLESTSATSTADSKPVSKSAEALQGEVDILRGQLEESEHRNQTLQADNKRLIDDMAELKLRMAKAAELAASGQQQTAAPVASTNGKQGASLLWDLGRKDLQNKDLVKAAVTFSELTKNYPKDIHSPWAQLAVGLIQYDLGKFKESAIEFNQFIDRYGKSKEAALAWFGQGASFMKLNQKGDAKLFYEEVVRRYPKTKASILAAKYLSKKTLGAPVSLLVTFSDWDAKAPQD